jgi:hypothetical protein
MVVQLLMGFLGELVFQSAASMRRSFDQEITRYLQQRGFDRADSKQTPTH